MTLSNTREELIALMILFIIYMKNKRDERAHLFQYATSKIVDIFIHISKKKAFQSLSSFLSPCILLLTDEVQCTVLYILVENKLQLDIQLQNVMSNSNT